VTWQHVERELFSLYTQVASASFADNVIWHTINSLEIKMKIIDALIQARKNPALSEKWGTTYNRLNRKKKFRDRFAHWSVLGDMNGGVYRTIYLTPPTTDYRERFFTTRIGIPDGAMEAPAIRQHIETFGKLSLEVRDILLYLLDTSPRISPEPPQPQPTPPPSHGAE
jgi:hypothetical protein